MFSDPLFILVVIAVLVVLAILLKGISTFGKGGADSAKQSNKYMRWRIYAQGIAVVIILIFVFFRRTGG
ncbi:Hypoxia induced protein conserved region [Palleronia salina]|uniref:Hypoxia induced protein conserved region n=2 Tax=Palleronia TaxID=315422 RepID=A0A1M6JK09_9RHOB|nr:MULTISPECIES: twin transmembrane helix small protein [Palleronia]SEM96386.1 Hypoxia induced protein conserved region [Palleronia pelagia]SHJ46993.1 Hypoxia induced protein conserved region [Palleronia salina]